MSYVDAMSAFAAAKAAGDPAAILAAAELLASLASTPKPARKPRKAASDIPAWFSAVAKSKLRAQHSLAVAFADGQRVRVNAWQDAGKPVAVGRALRVAVAFYRSRMDRTGRHESAVPAFSSVELVGGEAFDAAECSRLTDDVRAAIVAPAPEAGSERAARLARQLDAARADLARWTRLHAIEVARLCRLWHESEGAARIAIEERAVAADQQGRFDIASAERMVVQALRLVSDETAPAAPSRPAVSEAAAREILTAAFPSRAAPHPCSAMGQEIVEAAIADAEPLEAAYPDAEDEPEPTDPAPSVAAAAPCVAASCGETDPRCLEARARLAAIREARSLPFPDRGIPYRPRPRYRVKAGSRPSTWRPDAPIAPAPHLQLLAADPSALASAIIWERAGLAPVALVLLPWGRGTTIAKLDADGRLYGCRDVSPGPHHGPCVASWREKEAARGLTLVDLRVGLAPEREGSVAASRPAGRRVVSRRVESRIAA